MPGDLFQKNEDHPWRFQFRSLNPKPGNILLLLGEVKAFPTYFLTKIHELPNWKGFHGGARGGGSHPALGVSGQVGGPQKGVDGGAGHPGQGGGGVDGHVPPRVPQAAAVLAVGLLLLAPQGLSLQRVEHWAGGGGCSCRPKGLDAGVNGSQVL